MTCTFLIVSLSPGNQQRIVTTGTTRYIIILHSPSTYQRRIYLGAWIVSQRMQTESYMTVCRLTMTSFFTILAGRGRLCLYFAETSSVANIHVACAHRVRTLQISSR